MPSSLLLTDKVINDTFELFDTDGAGVLDLDSFNLALSSLGLGLNAAETEKLFSSESEDSPVSKAEFKKIVKTWNKNVTFHSEVQRMFGEFANGKDNINSAAFADVHEQIGWTDANDKIVRFIQVSASALAIFVDTRYILFYTLCFVYRSRPRSTATATSTATCG